jgi:TrbM.
MKTASCAVAEKPVNVAFVCAFLLLLSALMLPRPSLAAESGMPDLSGEYLTGTPKLACEAILCLSSSVGKSISECQPSLDHYFDIKKKKWSDTLDARKSFLNQCPAASEPGMPSLVNAISNGAGFCDAANLNVNNRITVYRVYDRSRRTWSGWQKSNNYNGDSNYPTCGSNPNSYSSWGDDSYSRYCQETKTVVSNQIDNRCINLVGHEWTDYTGLRYVGDMFDGGKWIDN